MLSPSKHLPRLWLQCVTALFGAVLFAPGLTAGDWPMARFDAQRSGAAPDALPEKLHLHWTRDYPPLEPAWPDQPKMQFDAAYNPIVAGDKLFLASSRHDWLKALDVATGRELWSFYADGPIRFAPVAWENRIYFVSDDGHLYCLKAADGELLWKHRGGPSDQRILGNERLVSAWPARGAPVIEDGAVYYGASIWPFMGIFIHALDARTGKVIWTNDGEGTNYIKQPHNTDSFATVAPQGHFAVIGDRLLAPSGRSIPGLFDRLTGKLLRYQLAENGKKGGGSDVAALGNFFFNGGAAFELSSQKYLGEVGTIVAANEDWLVTHSGSSIRFLDLANGGIAEVETVDRKGEKTTTKKWRLPELAGIRLGAAEDIILAGPRAYVAVKGKVLALELQRGAEEPDVVWEAEVAGTPARLVAASDRLLAVTLEGEVFCFGAGERKVQDWPLPAGRPIVADVDWSEKAALILKQTGAPRGYALVWGVGSGKLIHELLRQSKLDLLVFEPDAAKARAFRDQAVADNLERVQVIQGDPKSAPLPPYLASLIVSEDYPTQSLTLDTVERWFNLLRPYGGAMALPAAAEFNDLVRSAKIPGAALSLRDGWRFIRRPLGLPGAANWTHEHADASNTRVSKDKLVKAPLGILWFGGPPNDGILPRHGHGPQPQVIDGRLIIEGVDMMRALDIYTGRLLWETSLPGVGRFYNNLAHQAGANASGSNYVSTPEGIYIASGTNCVRLNPDTGKIETTFPVPPHPAAKGESLWSYINIHGDYLVGGAEPIIDPKTMPPDLRKAGPALGAEADEKTVLKALEKLFKTVRGFGDNLSGSKRLFVLNRHNGKVLWSVEADSYFRHNGTILGGGRLFTIDRLSGDQLAKYTRRGEDPPFPARLRVFDASSGKELWSTANDVFGTWLSYSEKHDLLLESGRVARDSLNDEPKGMRAYNASTGAVVWAKKEYSGPAMIRGDEVLQGQGACDIKTGKLKTRIDPISGAEVPWTWIRNYGCNTPAASEHLLTFRSGAAGFFDLCTDGGTGNLGGFRSSCTNNLIVAGGVLTVPDYTRTCTCLYQNQTSVGLIHLPEAEIWTSFGVKAVKGAVKRLGVNFGAPGDRRAEEGTLWLDFPSVGGVSPAVDIKTKPEKLETFRRHSSAFEGPLPWVASSGVRGVQELTLTLDKFALGAKKYTLRLYFAEPQDLRAGQRVFKVEAQGKVIADRLDIAKEAGGPRRTLVKEYRGIELHDELFLKFTPLPDSETPSAILSGLEIIEE